MHTLFIIAKSQESSGNVKDEKQFVPAVNKMHFPNMAQCGILSFSLQVDLHRCQCNKPGFSRYTCTLPSCFIILCQPHISTKQPQILLTLNLEKQAVWNCSIIEPVSDIHLSPYQNFLLVHLCNARLILPMTEKSLTSDSLQMSLINHFNFKLTYVLSRYDVNELRHKIQSI